MPEPKNLPPLIVIVGPTASGKTALGIMLAKTFNGEIVSADSRAIYKDLNIGTAKPMGQAFGHGPARHIVSDGVPHYLVDFVSPKQHYSAAHFKTDALAVIRDIQKRGKTAFLVGGTGFYIQAVTDNLTWPKVSGNPALRRKLEQKSAAELFATLKELDPDTAAIIDAQNPRRLIRALEVRIVSGKSFKDQRRVGPPLFRLCILGLAPDKETLITRIYERVENNLKRGLEAEVRQLVNTYSWQCVLSSTIEYQEWHDYLEGRATLAHTIAAIKTAERHYAKRQLTWFKKEPRVRWLKNTADAVPIVRSFLAT